MRDVIVLAGGASVREYNIRDIERRGHLIAVNDSAIYTKCDVAFTMDRLWLEGRQLLLKTLAPPAVWYREGTPKNFVPPKQWFSFVHDDGYPTVMLSEFGKLNGSNSGTCAINYAFQCRTHRVFLLGFDMQRGPEGEKHWYPDYPWATDERSGTKRGTYKDWVEEFSEIAAQFEMAGMEVYNVNHRSLIRAFPVVSFEKFKEMTK